MLIRLNVHRRWLPGCWEIQIHFRERYVLFAFFNGDFRGHFEAEFDVVCEKWKENDRLIVVDSRQYAADYNIT